MNRPISTYTSNSTLNGAEIFVDFNAKEKDYESGYHYYGARYYDSEVLTGWLSVDPMADKYPNVSPYNYCVWNPIRIVDPDGRDGWDKIAGFGIGVLTNVVPGTGGLRDTYTPNNSSDYNNALRTADNTSMAVGGVMITAGGAGMVAANTMVGSGVTVAVTGVGAIEGAVVVVAGGTVDATAAAVGIIGTTVTMQAASNASQGYNRGGTTIQSKTLWKSKGKDGAHIDVENPNPNNRRGRIHYQEGKKKYYYNAKTKEFEGAPKSINKRLQTDKDMQRAIKNGLKYLEP